MLPAHAQASVPSVLSFSGTGVGALGDNNDANDTSLLAKVMDSIIPEANAGGGGPGGNGFYVCALVMGDMVNITMAGLNRNDGDTTRMIREGMIPMDGSQGVISATSWTEGCGSWGEGGEDDPTESQQMATVAINPDDSDDTSLAVVVYPKAGGTFQLDVGAGPCPPAPLLYDCDDD
jgi:hypothetical protein